MHAIEVWQKQSIIFNLIVYNIYMMYMYTLIIQKYIITKFEIEYLFNLISNGNYSCINSYLSHNYIILSINYHEIGHEHTPIYTIYFTVLIYS